MLERNRYDKNTNLRAISINFRTGSTSVFSHDALFAHTPTACSAAISRLFCLQKKIIFLRFAGALQKCDLLYFEPVVICLFAHNTLFTSRALTCCNYWSRIQNITFVPERLLYERRSKRTEHQHVTFQNADKGPKIYSCSDIFPLNRISKSKNLMSNYPI